MFNSRALATASVAAVSLVVPAIASAQTPTPRHVGVYNYLRRHVIAHYGIDAVGRDIVTHGLSTGRRASDSDIAASIGVMERTLYPPRHVYRYTYTAPVSSPETATATPIAPAVQAAPVTSYVPPSPAPRAITTSTSSSSSLEACIIARESGGNPQAVNGQYEGLAQMSQSVWSEYGGTAYSSTPLGASAAEQESVLSHALAEGGASNWTPYDGC